ncbi:MAG TPA: DUF1659 domain-containing protein [Syntrophomonadaceae bacterium]|nr:DUF1659 domain-containing protein [Syntrophomonadaceae bacterium]
MSVTSTPVSTDLVLVMDNGISATGKAQTKDQVFKSVNTLASNDEMYSAAQVLLALQEKTNLSVQRRDTVELIQS